MVIEKDIQRENLQRRIIVVSIPQDIWILFDIFRIIDEGDIGMLHNKLVIVKDVADKANQLDTMRLERWVKLLVDSQQF